jgi:hypothetical protein
LLGSIVPIGPLCPKVMVVLKSDEDIAFHNAIDLLASRYTVYNPKTTNKPLFCVSFVSRIVERKARHVKWTVMSPSDTDAAPFGILEVDNSE